ncbi:MAG: thioredoxin domain-containing protein [Deltaproteobacteria bacterium]
MRIKYLGAALTVLALFTFVTAVFAETISPKEAARLQSFLKKRLGAAVTPDTTIDVKGYEKSPIAGFKKGTFVVKSPRGSGDVGFLVSEDGKYVVFGEPIDVTKFEDTKVPGIKRGNAAFGKQSFPMLMSKDGKYLILADLMDSTIDPFKETMNKISLSDVPVLGDKNAKVTIVEYSDFQCPFCKKGAEMMPPILQQYKGKVKLVYKQFPLPNHAWAKDAAIGSLCAYKQGNDNFWKFHDLVFAKQKEITVDKSKELFKGYAAQAGLDKKKFDACFSSPETAKRVDAELAEGQSVGVNSTPTFLVNGQPVPGANPEALKAAIESNLAAK